MYKESMVGRRLYAKVLDVLILFVLVFLFDGMVSKSLQSKITDIDEIKASYVINSDIYEDIQDEYQIYIYDTNGNREYNDDVTQEVKDAFLNDSRILALNDVLQKEQKQIILYFVLRIMFSIFVPAFILYGVIPLLLKDGKTIGRLAAKLIVINNNGTTIKWYKTLLRALASILINIYLAILTLGIIPLASLIVAIVIKENKSFVDLVARTKVIDGKIPYFITENN